MKPVVFVSFTVTIHTSLAIEHEFPNISIDDLQKYILEHGPKNFGMPYVVTVKCKNNVVDTDKTCEKIPLLRQHDYINNHPIISTEDDCKFDIIMPKLIYANDVKEHLIKTYGTLGKFDPKKFDPKTPVFLDVFEHTGTGLRNSKTGAPTHMKWYTVNCKPLSKKDVVVDERLNQIWPAKTNKPPVGLVELLNKQTEKVY